MATAPSTTQPAIEHDRRVLARFVDAAATAPLVSFDVFDTLIVRFFGAPHDLFAALADRFPTVPDLARHRIAAEARARRLAAARGEAEITLSAIYAELAPFLRSFDPDEVAAAEMALELACVRADPHVVGAFDGLVAAGRRVILVSDMYLPTACVEAMLARCGIAGFERLLLSSETLAAKADGSVWPLVRAEFGLGGTDRIVHLGDNPQSDGAAARAAGVDAHLLTPPAGRQVRSRLCPAGHYLADCFSALLQQDLVARRDQAHFDPYWLMVAHLVVAPAAIGMAGLVHRQARARVTDRVFFLARDGQVFQRAYEAGWRALDEAASQYVWCSRRCVNVAAIEAVDDQALRFLTSGWPDQPTAYLQRIDLDVNDPEVGAALARFFPDPEPRLTQPDQMERLRGMMRALEHRIVAQASDEREALLAHLDACGLYDGPGIVVDLGWHGSLQRSLIEIGHRRSGHVPPLSGAYLGTFEQAIRTAGGAAMQATGWLFEHGEPRDHLAAVMRSVEVIELLFSAPESGIRRVRRTDAGLVAERYQHATEQPRLELAALFHGVVERTATALRPLLQDGHVTVLAGLAASGFDTLLRRPDRDDIAHFGPMPHAQGFGDAGYRPIVAPIRAGVGMKALLGGLNGSFWRQGYLGSLDPRQRAGTQVLAALQSQTRALRLWAGRTA